MNSAFSMAWLGAILAMPDESLSAFMALSSEHITSVKCPLRASRAFGLKIEGREARFIYGNVSLAMFLAASRASYAIFSQWLVINEKFVIASKQLHLLHLLKYFSFHLFSVHNYTLQYRKLSTCSEHTITGNNIIVYV